METKKRFQQQDRFYEAQQLTAQLEQLNEQYEHLIERWCI